MDAKMDTGMAVSWSKHWYKCSFLKSNINVHNAKTGTYMRYFCWNSSSASATSIFQSSSMIASNSGPWVPLVMMYSPPSPLQTSFQTNHNKLCGFHYPMGGVCEGKTPTKDYSTDYVKLTSNDINKESNQKTQPPISCSTQQLSATPPKI